MATARRCAKKRIEKERTRNQLKERDWREIESHKSEEEPKPPTSESS